MLTLELMYSEDSGVDEDEGILVVRPLPWHSTRVDEVFIQIFIMFWLLVLHCVSHIVIFLPPTIVI